MTNRTLLALATGLMFFASLAITENANAQVYSGEVYVQGPSGSVYYSQGVYPSIYPYYPSYAYPIFTYPSYNYYPSFTYLYQPYYRPYAYRYYRPYYRDRNRYTYTPRRGANVRYNR